MTLATERTDTPATAEYRPRGHPVATLATVVVVVAAASLGSWWFGALTPRLGVSGGTSTWDTDTHRFQETLLVDNEAHASVELVSAGRSGPGLRLDAVLVRPNGADEGAAGPDSTPWRRLDRFELAPGDAAEVTLYYRVTDCDAVVSGSWPVPVTARTALGVERTVGVHPVGDPPDRWQERAAGDACGTG